MDDSFILSNYNMLCRLCLCKCSLMVSIYGKCPDEESDLAITSKITSLFDLQISPDDGLPGKICYKCLYKLDNCMKFKLQCIQNEARLLEIGQQLLEKVNSIQVDCKPNMKPKENNYVVEDSVVMVVDPSLDYNSSEESDNIEKVEPETSEREILGEPMQYYKNIAMCQYCDQAFANQEKCIEHEQTLHDPNLPFNCVECSLVFSERSQHIHHTKKVHGNDKPYYCPECSKCFGRRSDLRKHSIVHTGIRPYQCHYCFKNFSRNTNLSKHLRIHAGQKPHVCPICPKSFVAKTELQRHVLVHSGMKPYSCQKCPLTFGRKDKLLKHETKHGSNQENQTNSENDSEPHDIVVNVNPFSDLLSSPTQNSSELDLPRVPDHISGESSFVARPHLKKSPKQNSPTKPASNKNKPKNIKCHQCPKRFSSLDAYKTHVSIAHIGSHLFQCKICFKKFSRKRELDKHFALHGGMKPFSCNKCDEKFTRRDKLNNHIDSEECVYSNMPCTECGATFEKKSDLVAHIKSHFNDTFETKEATGEVKQELIMEATH